MNSFQRTKKEDPIYNFIFFIFRLVFFSCCCLFVVWLFYSFIHSSKDHKFCFRLFLKVKKNEFNFHMVNIISLSSYCFLLFCFVLFVEIFWLWPTFSLVILLLLLPMMIIFFIVEIIKLVNSVEVHMSVIQQKKKMYDVKHLSFSFFMVYFWRIKHLFFFKIYLKLSVLFVLIFILLILNPVWNW